MADHEGVTYPIPTSLFSKMQHPPHSGMHEVSYVNKHSVGGNKDLGVGYNPLFHFFFMICHPSSLFIQFP